MQIEYLVRPFEVKGVNFEERTFEGYAAVFGNIDHGRDVIEKGAFARTIEQRVAAGKVKLTDQHNVHSTQSLVGKILAAKEDAHGLWVKAYVSAVKAGDEILTKIKEGVLDSLSIGYDVIKEAYDEIGGRSVRRLHEVRLWEVSVVTFPMNELALINPLSVKAVPPMQSWPLADENISWDAAKAQKNLAKVASSDGSGDKDKMDWKKYQKYFFWYDDENPENFTSYKLCYCDVVDGEVKAIPRAIFAVAAVLQGARGGVDIPEEDKAKIKEQVEAWYKKMGRTAPWKGLVFLAEAVQAFGSPEEIKEGRVLSRANRELIAKAIEVLTALLEAAESPEKALQKAQGLAAEEEVQALQRELELLKIRASAN